MGSIQFKTFAVKKAYVAAYSASVAATWTEMPLVADSTITLAVARAEVRDGEGSLQYTWRHTQDGTVSLRAKDYSLLVLEMVTGNAISSVGAAERMYFGSDEELTPPLVRLKLIATALKSDNTEGYFQVVCYKVQGDFPSLGMAETTPGEVTIDFQLLKSERDHQANACISVFGHLEAVTSTMVAA